MEALPRRESLREFPGHTLGHSRQLTLCSRKPVEETVMGRQSPGDSSWEIVCRRQYPRHSLQETVSRRHTAGDSLRKRVSSGDSF